MDHTVRCAECPMGFICKTYANYGDMLNIPSSKCPLAYLVKELQERGFPSKGGGNPE